MTSTRQKAGLAGLAVAVLVGAWGAWMVGRSSEHGSRPEADPRSSAGPAAPGDPGRASVETTDDPGSEAPAARIDRSPPSACALAVGSPECSFLAPDEETLLEMARCGIVRLDAPVPPPPESKRSVFPKEWLEMARVDEAERERLEAAAAAFMEKQRTRWADLAASFGIDRAWSDATVPLVIVSRIAAEFDDDQVVAALQRVARERAGLEPGNRDIPAPLDAAIRLRVDGGDAFEAAIAEAVGEDRAAELRAVADGWPGSHSYMGNHCDRDPVPPPERRMVPRTADEAEACVADIKGRACSFLDPTQLELDRMADCGIVRINIPSFLHDRSVEPTFGEAWADEVGLTFQEAAALAEVAEEYRDALYAELTELLLATGKSREFADQTSFLGLMAALHEASPMSDEEEEAMLRQLAAEKAGRVAPPTDLSRLSLAERITRLNLEFGDILEKALATRLGPERARALRHANDGWPGPRIQSNNFCDGSEPQLL